MAGWMNQRQQHAIDYLREENQALQKQLGSRRLRLNDDQRRRLAGVVFSPSKQVKRHGQKWITTPQNQMEEDLPNPALVTTDAPSEF
jgi:hypothetical protein